MGRLAITIGIRLLEILFVFGLAGSALVVILTGIEDLKETFTKEKRGRD